MFDGCHEFFMVGCVPTVLNWHHQAKQETTTKWNAAFEFGWSAGKNVFLFS
jgi:hypothetical protein